MYNNWMLGIYAKANTFRLQEKGEGGVVRLLHPHRMHL